MSFPRIEILKRKDVVLFRSFYGPITLEITGPGYVEVLSNVHEIKISRQQYDQSLQIVVAPTSPLKEVQA